MIVEAAPCILQYEAIEHPAKDILPLQVADKLGLCVRHDLLLAGMDILDAELTGA